MYFTIHASMAMFTHCNKLEIFLLELSVMINSSTYACNTSILEHTEQEFSRICPWHGASTWRPDRSVINVTSAG